MTFTRCTCGITLNSYKKSSTVSNIRVTHNSKVQCDICDKTLTNPNLLFQHKVFYHKETEGAFICEICPRRKHRVFKSQESYDKHKKDYHGSTPMVSDDQLSMMARVVNDDQSILNDDQNIVNDDQSIVNDIQNIVNDNQNIVSDDQNMVNGDQDMVNEYDDA
jgi:hypothetical protein